MLKPLGRSAILDVVDIKIEQVDIPEWGGSVYVKGMTAGEREEFEKLYSDNKGKPANIRAQLASMTLCDKDGKLLFSLKDAKALGEKSASAMMQVFDLARKLSRMGQKDVDELSEGLEENPSGDSASD